MAVVTPETYATNMLLLERYAQQAVYRLMFQVPAYSEQLTFRVYLDGHAGTWQYDKFQAMYGSETAVKSLGNVSKSQVRAGTPQCVLWCGEEHVWVSEATIIDAPLPLRFIVECLQMKPQNQAALGALPQDERDTVNFVLQGAVNVTLGHAGSQCLSQQASVLQGVSIGTLSLLVDRDLDRLYHCNFNDFTESMLARLRALVRSLCQPAGIVMPTDLELANVALPPTQQPTYLYFGLWRKFTEAIFDACCTSWVSLKIGQEPLRLEIKKALGPRPAWREDFSTQILRRTVIQDHGTTAVDGWIVVRGLRNRFPGLTLDQKDTECVRHGGSASWDDVEELADAMCTLIDDLCWELRLRHTMPTTSEAVHDFAVIVKAQAAVARAPAL